MTRNFRLSHASFLKRPMRKKKKKKKNSDEKFSTMLILESQTELALNFLSLFGTILRVVKIKVRKKRRKEKKKNKKVTRNFWLPLASFLKRPMRIKKEKEKERKRKQWQEIYSYLIWEKSYQACFIFLVTFWNYPARRKDKVRK